MGNNMKNVLLLVVDELAYTRIGDIWRNGNTTTPFLDSIRDSSIWAENMYSQAPYTESAIRGLLGGRNVLDEPRTMLHQFDINSTCFDDLEGKGYDVFTLGMDYQEEYNTKRRNHMQILNEFGYSAVWNYRLKYYGELKRTVGLSNKDYDIIYDFLEKAFKQYITFYDLLLSDSNRVDFVREHYEVPEVKVLQKERAIYSQELSLLKSDKLTYIDDLMIKGESYFLFHVSKWIHKSLINDKELESKIYREWMPVIKKLKKVSFWHNISNTKLKGYDIINACRECISGNWKMGSRHMKLLGLNHIDLLRERMCGRQIVPSGSSFLRADVAFEFFRRWYLKHQKAATPFFAYLHVVDLHAPAKITRPITEEKELRRQVRLVNEFIDRLSPHYKGSLNNDCALRMVDDFVEGMFRQMKEDGILEKTYVVITSDHGCSYTYCPPRNDMVNVFYAEQYRVPFIVYGNDIEPTVVDRLCETKDIMPTLYDILGLKTPEYFSGKSILKPNKDSEIVIHEYMGGGCPDVSHRPILFCLRTKEWKICYHVKLKDSFENGNITEIHYLKKDPLERNNLVYSQKYDKDQIEALVGLIKERFETIKCKFQL